MSSKQDALSQISTLVKEHSLTLLEIEKAIIGEQGLKQAGKDSGGIAMRIFSILGGIFIFAGISTYIGMFWGEMNSAMRVIITLGSGFVAYLLGVIFSRDASKIRMVAPILLIAAFLESGGLFVLINEYFNNNTHNWRLACLIVFGVMLLQQGFTLLALRIPVLLFTTIWFGASFFYIAFDIQGVDEEWNAIIIGISLLSIAYGLRNSNYRRILQLAYFFGSVMFLGGAFDVMKYTPLYLVLTCFMIYISVIVHSTTLLTVSVLAMLAYIGYFTAEHFVNSVGWPVALIVIGVLFSAISAGALRIKKKYIS